MRGRVPRVPSGSRAAPSGPTVLHAIVRSHRARDGARNALVWLRGAVDRVACCPAEVVRVRPAGTARRSRARTPFSGWNQLGGWRGRRGRGYVVVARAPAEPAWTSTRVRPSACRRAGPRTGPPLHCEPRPPRVRARAAGSCAARPLIGRMGIASWCGRSLRRHARGACARSSRCARGGARSPRPRRRSPAAPPSRAFAASAWRSRRDCARRRPPARDSELGARHPLRGGLRAAGRVVPVTAPRKAPRGARAARWRRAWPDRRGRGSLTLARLRDTRTSRRYARRYSRPGTRRSDLASA